MNADSPLEFITLTLVMLSSVAGAAIVFGHIADNQTSESFGWTVLAVTLLFAIVISLFVLWSLVLGGFA